MQKSFIYITMRGIHFIVWLWHSFKNLEFGLPALVLKQHNLLKLRLRTLIMRYYVLLHLKRFLDWKGRNCYSSRCRSNNVFRTSPRPWFLILEML